MMSLMNNKKMMRIQVVNNKNKNNQEIQGQKQKQNNLRRVLVREKRQREELLLG